MSIQITDEVGLLKATLGKVAERYGFFMVESDLRAERMRAINPEMRELRRLNEVMEKETDGQKIKEIHEKIKEVKARLSEKSKPFFAEISPVHTVVKFYDMLIIPKALMECGFTIIPKKPDPNLVEIAKKALAEAKRGRK